VRRANSHVAAVEAFPDGLPLPCFDFADALDAVKSGKADRAIIPIENSLHRRVADIHFLLPESAGDRRRAFPVDPPRPDGDGGRDGLVEAMSHPQALGQCRHWLRAHGICPIAYADTAGAAARVAEMGDASIAALAPAARRRAVRPEPAGRGCFGRRPQHDLFRGAGARRPAAGGRRSG
jgi:prephenate dehydratase